MPSTSEESSVRRSKVFQKVMLLFVMCTASSLLYAKGNTLQPELYQAIDKNDTARARFAIARGADVNAIYDRDTLLCCCLLYTSDAADE